jgi:hypothetical protein
MRKVHHVIYVPGLDDQRKGYEILINRWSIYSVIPHVHRVGWKDGENDFEPKLQRLIAEVKRYNKRGHIVSLVGGSAGGSAVLNTFLGVPEINAVVNICGRLKAGNNVSPTLEQAAGKSPAFKQSVELFERREPNMKEEQRKRVLTLTPLWDEVVPRETVWLEGAVNKTMPSIEHMVSGLLGMTIFSPMVIGFVKHMAKKGNYYERS